MHATCTYSNGASISHASVGGWDGEASQTFLDHLDAGINQGIRVCKSRNRTKSSRRHFFPLQLKKRGGRRGVSSSLSPSHQLEIRTFCYNLEGEYLEGERERERKKKRREDIITCTRADMSKGRRKRERERKKTQPPTFDELAIKREPETNPRLLTSHQCVVAFFRRGVIASLLPSLG